MGQGVFSEPSVAASCAAPVIPTTPTAPSLTCVRSSPIRLTWHCPGASIDAEFEVEMGQLSQALIVAREAAGEGSAIGMPVEDADTVWSVFTVDASGSPDGSAGAAFQCTVPFISARHCPPPKDPAAAQALTLQRICVVFRVRCVHGDSSSVWGPPCHPVWIVPFPAKQPDPTPVVPAPAAASQRRPRPPPPTGPKPKDVSNVHMPVPPVEPTVPNDDNDSDDDDDDDTPIIRPAEQSVKGKRPPSASDIVGHTDDEASDASSSEEEDEDEEDAFHKAMAARRAAAAAKK